MIKLVGYKKGTSKKGEPYCMAHVLMDATPSEQSAGFVGAKTDTVFLPQHQVDTLKTSDIGKEVVMDYVINYGRAYLDNFIVK